MAVLQSTIWEVAPGRTAEVIGHMAHAKQIQERLGSKVRALQVLIAGPTSNRIAYVLRHDSLTAYGQYATALNTDPEWLAFQQTVLGSASPSASLVSHALSSELPGFEGPFTVTGTSVTTLTQVRPNPGGLEGTMQQIKTVKSVVERLGATLSARQNFIAGENTGTIGVAVTYDDLAAFGKGTDALLADPEYQGVLARTTAADAPGVILSRAQAVEIPL